MTGERKPVAWWGPRMDLLAGLVVFFVINVLIQQWSSVYLGIAADSVPEPTPDAIVGYWVAAGVALGVLVLGFVIAKSQRRIAAMIAYPLVGVVALATVMLLAVPQIPLPADPVYPVNPNGCYRTDSENCPGG